MRPSLGDRRRPSRLNRSRWKCQGFFDNLRLLVLAAPSRPTHHVALSWSCLARPFPTPSPLDQMSNLVILSLC